MRLKQEQRDLAQRHLHLIRPIANRARRHLPGHVEVADLIGPGIDGLLQAAARFDPSRGLPFAAFAIYRIRGAIYDAIRAECRHNALRRRLLVVPTVREDSPDETLADRRAARMVHRALDALPAREQAFLRAVYFEERAQFQAGEALGISSSWASRLHTRSLRHLRTLVKAA